MRVKLFYGQRSQHAAAWSDGLIRALAPRGENFAYRNPRYL